MGSSESRNLLTNIPTCSRDPWTPVPMYELSCLSEAKFFTWPVFLTTRHNLSSRVGSHNLEVAQSPSGLYELQISISQLDLVLQFSRHTKRSAQIPFHIFLCTVAVAILTKLWSLHLVNMYYFFLTDYYICPQLFS